MLKFFKISKYTGIVSIIALVIALGAAGLAVADAYSVRTTVLAKVLQSVGLCPLPENVASKPLPTVTVTATPEAIPSPSLEPTTSASPKPSSKPTISSDPSATPVKGAAGTNGANGSAGTAGATGMVGEKGETGASGSSGSTGAQGPAGPQGPAGVCDVSNILPITGDLVPAVDNVYSLGTAAKRWKSLHVGPGTIYIQDSELVPPTEVALTVRSGALLLDGANSLRIGSIQISNTGLTSTSHTTPITLGDTLFNSFIDIKANGLRFRDGTTQTTAIVRGPTGLQGAQGPQGPPGEPSAGGIPEGYKEAPICIALDDEKYLNNTMVFGNCDELKIKGTDIFVLKKLKE